MALEDVVLLDGFYLNGRNWKFLIYTHTKARTSLIMTKSEIGQTYKTPESHELNWHLNQIMAGIFYFVFVLTICYVKKYCLFIIKFERRIILFLYSIWNINSLNNIFHEIMNIWNSYISWLIYFMTTPGDFVSRIAEILFIYLFIYLFILLRLGVTYIKTLKTITKPGRDTTTVRTNYCGPKSSLSHCINARYKIRKTIVLPSVFDIVFNSFNRCIVL